MLRIRQFFTSLILRRDQILHPSFGFEDRQTKSYGQRRLRKITANPNPPAILREDFRSMLTETLSL